MFPSLLRVQPVAPERPSGPDLFGDVVAAAALVLLSAVFLMLGLDAAHDLFPIVPEAGYWQSVALVLGLQTVGSAARGPAFKWARR